MATSRVGLVAFALLCVAIVQCVRVIDEPNGDVYYQQPLIVKQQRPLREHEKPQDFSKIPGTPGVDYPIFHAVPKTNFHCADVPVAPGMYANVETGCQAYHVCHDGREGHQGASFLCTNGTIFNQKEFACDWWYNVDCGQALQYYRLNADPDHNPYTPKKKVVEVEDDKYLAYDDGYAH